MRVSSRLKGGLPVWINGHSLRVLLLALGCAAVIWFGLGEFSFEARLALTAFALAVIGWVFTRINDTYIAVAAALVFTLSGVEEPDAFFEALGDPMIWLLLAAFVVATAVKASGLAQRLVAWVAARVGTVNGLFYTLTAVIIATAFFVPSTSGRAALLLPVLVAFASSIANPRIVKALALMFPVAILLSAVASLIGAGAHLITADLVGRLGGEKLDFGRWLMLGFPLALVSTYLSVWVIARVFLTPAERQAKLDLRSAMPTGKMAGKEGYTLAVLLALVGLWASEPLHGINNTMVALLGALAVTLPGRGPISFKEGLKGVEWSLLLFMAATLELGEALVNSGGARLLLEGLFASFNSTALASPLVVVSTVILISLLSHLLIVSRTARSTVLVPLVVVLAVSLGYSSTALAFISTAAAGYCLTLLVSAKPVTLFAQLEFPTYTQADLLRLSGVLMPLHGMIFLVFALGVWPWMGLGLKSNPSPQASTVAASDKNSRFGIQYKAPLVSITENSILVPMHNAANLAAVAQKTQPTQHTYLKSKAETTALKPIPTKPSQPRSASTREARAMPLPKTTHQLKPAVSERAQPKPTSAATVKPKSTHTTTVQSKPLSSRMTVATSLKMAPAVKPTSPQTRTPKPHTTHQPQPQREIRRQELLKQIRADQERRNQVISKTPAPHSPRPTKPAATQLFY